MTNTTSPRLALGALLLLNLALGAFAIQLAAGKVPIPEAWAWAVPILQAVVMGATTLLPRAGSENLAAQVDALKADGVDKRDMVVVASSDVQPLALSAEQRAVILADLKAEMTRDPAGRLATPRVPPDPPPVPDFDWNKG